MAKVILTQTVRAPKNDEREGGRFLPGQEAALLPTLSKEEIAALIEREILVEVPDVGTEISDGERMSGDGLEAQMLRVLLPHVGESGQSEGAVEVIERIIRERDESQENAQSVRTENDKFKTQIAEAKEATSKSKGEATRAKNDLEKAQADLKKAQAELETLKKSA